MLVNPDAPSAPRAPPPRRRVVDWHNTEIGHVLAAHRDPRTEAIDGLVVALTPGARERLRSPDGSILVPMRHVVGLRRDEVMLDCDLARLGA